MEHKRYVAYKDSGIDWLGVVPEHWDLVRFRFMFSESKERNGNAPVGNMLSVSGYRGIEEKEYEHESKKRTDEELETYRVVRPNQLAVNTMWLNHRGLGVSSLTGHVSPAYSVYDISHELLPAYAHHLLRSDAYVDGYKTYLYGIRPNSFQIKDDDFRSIPVLVPSSDEQQSIAQFLDRETARIDALIEKKQRLIELLKEKRQAVITQAVTKGLDPTVPMKDSGVEWLGEVPEYWEVLPLKRLVETPITDGPHETPDFVDEGIPFVSAEAVGGGEVNFEKIRGYITEEDHRRYSRKYLPKRNDIYIIKSGATTGTVAIVDTDAEFNIWSPLAAVRCNGLVLPRYVLHCLRSRNIQDAIALSWSFGTQQNIGMGVLGNIRIPVPPLDEQQRLLDVMDRIGDSSQQLVRKTERSIELLKEHRSALITAAVTGQIDVRDAA